MTNRIQVSIGHAGYWGYSATFDVLEALLGHNGCCGDSHAYPGGSTSEPIRVLLVHPGDIRHVMTTISKRKRHHGSRSRLEPLRPIHFYLLENPVQVMSRNLLLLEVLYDFEVPIRQRAAVFLEIFGNARVQDRTCRYVEQLGNDLRAFMASGSGRLEGLVDFSLLKYRERDELETAFRAYSRSFEFNMETLRDHRMRGLYEDRYDVRKNLADWDYHDSVKPRASIIHIKQFKEWRLSGIAFELGDQVYSEPNRTMASYAEGIIKQGKEKGTRTDVLGFWGDIAAGPFFSFGVDCDTPNTLAEGLFEILNKGHGTEQHRHHTVEVAMYALFSLLWELETGTVYRMKKKNDIYSGLGSEAGLAMDLAAQTEALKLEVEGEAEGEAEGAEAKEAIVEQDGKESVVAQGDAQTLPPPPVDAQVPPTPAPAPALSPEQAEEELLRAMQRAECIVDSLAGCYVFPLLGLPSAVLDKPKWQGYFDCVFVSARAASCIEPAWFGALVKPETGLVCIESAKFIVPLSNAQKKEFTAKEQTFCAGHGWTKVMAPPVPRRHRDELDAEDDVLFYKPARQEGGDRGVAGGSC